MPALNLAGCPIGVRFTVLKMESTGNWHARLVKVHNYIGPIELDQLFKEGKLHKHRIYPRPRGGSEEKYDWTEPTITEMWEESLTTQELREYLDD